MTNIVTQLMDLGRDEGCEEIAYNLLENGCEPIFVVKNTGLSLDRCKEICAQLKPDQS